MAKLAVVLRNDDLKEGDLLPDAIDKVDRSKAVTVEEEQF